MRYTTLIDISQYPLYRNCNVRLVYMHLCLRAGYHDGDRDMIAISYRQLASEVGITLSACRHALKVLAADKLIQQQDGFIWVKKWLQDPVITPRKEVVKKAQARAIAAHQQQRDAENQQYQDEMTQIRASGKTSLQVYIERLEARAADGDLEAIEILKRRKKQ